MCEYVCVYVCVEVYFPSGVLVLNCFPPNLPLLHSRWQFTALLCVRVSVSWKKLLDVRSLFNAMLHSPYIKKSPTSTFTHHIFLHYYSFIPSNWLKIWLWSQIYFFLVSLKLKMDYLKTFTLKLNFFLSFALMVMCLVSLLFESLKIFITVRLRFCINSIIIWVILSIYSCCS